MLGCLWMLCTCMGFSMDTLYMSIYEVCNVTLFIAVQGGSLNV